MPTTRSLRRTFLTALAATAVMAPSAPAQTQQDVVTSDNVEHLGNFREVANGVGARIIGDRMFVTSLTHLMVYDISEPENPQRLGSFTAEVQFENEDVPTNGKILGISAQLYGLQCAAGEQASGCLNLYDVSDPESISLIKSVTDSSEHTMECMLDCTYFYGSDGKIVDARTPAEAEVIEPNWVEAATDQGVEFTASSHDVTEVAPGIMVAASQPLVMMSLRPEHGGSAEAPVVIATATNEDSRFIHSVEWPREARDRWLLVGGETVIPVAQDGGPCSDEKAAFMTWDSSAVINPAGGWNTGSDWTLVDEVRPYNGTYTDGGHVVDAFGCSMHWFEAHPTFRNGGVVAMGAYEHGVRIYQVAPDGKITEQGYGLPIVGAVSAAYWTPGGEVFYTIDYERGMDIWRYTGDAFQGPPDAPSGGGGGSSDDAPKASLDFMLTPRRTSKSRFLKRGLTARGECSRACTVSARLKKGRRTVSRAKVREAAESFTMRLKVSKKQARKMRRSKRIKLRLIAKATAADGRTAKLRRTVVVK